MLLLVQRLTLIFLPLLVIWLFHTNSIYYQFRRESRQGGTCLQPQLLQRLRQKACLSPRILGCSVLCRSGVCTKLGISMVTSCKKGNHWVAYRGVNRPRLEKEQVKREIHQNPVITQLLSTLIWTDLQKAKKEYLSSFNPPPSATLSSKQQISSTGSGCCKSVS